MTLHSLFNAVCSRCECLKPRCATLAVRGTTAWGDPETRVMTICADCRKFLRGLYRVHPKHKTKAGGGK